MAALDRNNCRLTNVGPTTGLPPPQKVILSALLHAVPFKQTLYSAGKTSCSAGGLQETGVTCQLELTHASALTKDDGQHLQEAWPSAPRPLCRCLQKMEGTPHCRWLPPPLRVTRTSPTSSSLLPTLPLGMRSTVSAYYEICVFILLVMCLDTSTTTLCCPRCLCAQR
jgi:hypothetical protein